MLNKDYGRTIALRCPTCGGKEFSGATEGNDDSEVIMCAGCRLEITRADLQAANTENIQAHVKEIGQQVTADLQKELKKKLENAFRGNKNIRIK